MTSTIHPADVGELAGTYVIDPSHSRVGFSVRHAMVTTLRGAFNNFEANVHVDAQDFGASTATVTVDVASLDTRNAQRDGHVMSDDFLAVAEFPQITFTSTAVNQTGANSFALVGDLTVKGITRSVTIPFDYYGSARDPFGNERHGFEGTVTINRKDFGISWNAVLETGGVMLGEAVTLEFELSAIKVA